VPYTKQTWVNGPSGNTRVNATRLGYIETGIETAQATAEAAAGTAVGPAGTVPVSTGTTVVYTQLASANVGITTFELTPGGNYTFVLADLGKLKGSLTSDTAAVNFTIPANATTPFPIGATMKALQRGTGQITTVGAAGVGLLAVGSAYKSAGTGGTLLYTKLFVDTWLVEGGVL
jgi:hypothetical protein